MSNFSAFDKTHLGLLIEPFLPGAVVHITPIRYEALTPDSFLLLFMTKGKDGQEHFFVSFETDYVSSLEGAKCVIEDWHGDCKEFFAVDGSGPKDSDDITMFKTQTHEPYFALLAKVGKPKGRGYWSEKVTIMPGDSISDAITGFSEEEQVSIRKALAGILRHKLDTSLPFADSFQAKHENTIIDDKNVSDTAVTIYKSPNGGFEYFSNFVKPQ